MTSTDKGAPSGAPRSDAKGNAFQSRGRWFARPSLGGGKRKAVLLPHAHDQPAAEARARFIAELVGQIRQAGKANIVDLEAIVREAASAPTEAELTNLQTVVNEVCGGVSRPALRAGGAPGSATTFGELADDWTSGRLHERHPDYVKSKRSVDDDEERLAKHVLPHVKDVRIVDFTLKHALGVMSQLPAKLRPATRRQVAQLMSRILHLAVFPCEIIPSSPLPRGFLPRTGTPRVSAFLYPDEDATLLAASPDKVPLCFRILFGFLDREGCRTSEAAALTWKDVDFKKGVLWLDKNKTNRPRHWKLNRGVLAGLKLWHKHRGKPSAEAPIFVDHEGAKVEGTVLSKLADTFRDYLKAAGVDRPQLFDDTEERRPIRAHDLRGTFVTISLEVEGHSETWVMRRTGHRTSAMLAKYRKQFETASELELGSVRPLDEAIPELAQLAANSGQGGSDDEESTGQVGKNKLKNQELSRSGGMADAADSKFAIANSETPRAALNTDSEASKPIPPGAPAATLLPPEIGVESALAKALAEASAAGRWDVVAQLAKELEARRFAAAGNVVAFGRRQREDR